MLAKSITRISLVCVAITTALGDLIAPAAETVTANLTSANVSLFRGETLQLTDKVVAELQANPNTAKYAHLFEFDGSPNSTTSARTRRIGKSLRCKTMSGDPLYPDKTTWEIFDNLLGGALEKIIPIGSPCYKESEYGNYDSMKCTSLVRNFDQEDI